MYLIGYLFLTSTPMVLKNADKIVYRQPMVCLRYIFQKKEYQLKQVYHDGIVYYKQRHLLRTFYAQEQSFEFSGSKEQHLSIVKMTIHKDKRQSLPSRAE